MTPAGRPAAAVPDGASDGEDTAGSSLAEDVLDALVPFLHPHQAEAEAGGEVADEVRGVLVLAPPLDLPAAGRAGAQPGRPQRLAEQPLGVGLALDLDDEAAGRVQELRGGRRTQEPPTVEHPHVVADPLELAEQVRGDQYRDAELVADLLHQR